MISEGTISMLLILRGTDILRAIVMPIRLRVCLRVSGRAIRVVLFLRLLTSIAIIVARGLRRVTLNTRGLCIAPLVALLRLLLALTLALLSLGRGSLLTLARSLRGVCTSFPRFGRGWVSIFKRWVT